MIQLQSTYDQQGIPFSVDKQNQNPISEDAADTNVKTLDFEKASKDIAWIAIHVISNVKMVAIHVNVFSQDHV